MIASRSRVVASTTPPRRRAARRHGSLLRASLLLTTVTPAVQAQTPPAVAPPEPASPAAGAGPGPSAADVPGVREEPTSGTAPGVPRSEAGSGGPVPAVVAGPAAAEGPVGEPGAVPAAASGEPSRQAVFEPRPWVEVPAGGGPVAPVPRPSSVAPAATAPKFFDHAVALAAAPVWAQGQSRWTLLPRKLTNRDLRLQLAGQPFRVAPPLARLALAADASAGAQLARRRDELTRFHGFFLIDAFAELMVVDGLSVNLNLTALNPSASDGYRFSSQILPGVAIHVGHELFELGGEPLRLDFVAPDLDVVTLGNGLLVEEIPLEGYAVGLRWAGVELKSMLGGRVFWGDDDLVAASLAVFEGALGVTFTRWMTEQLGSRLAYPSVNSGSSASVQFGPNVFADYVTLHAGLVVALRLRLAGEYGVRLRLQPRHAALARVDWLDLDLAGFAVHVGYQLRYYGEGFGPRGRLSTASIAPSLPYREDAYVTNSFEYLGLSADYTQWSHTFLAEIEAPITSGLVVFGWGELWRRSLDAPKTRRVVYVQRFGRAPGTSTELYYRAGVRLMPWPARPHRLSAFMTNKLVASRGDAEVPESRRFVHPNVLVLEVEVFL